MMTTPTPIEIRAARLHDLFSLEGLLHRAIAEANGLLPDYDHMHLAQMTIELMKNGLVVVATEPLEGNRERLVGVFMLSVRSWSWNPAFQYLDSVHFYVHPEYRARSIADGRSVADGLRDAGQSIADNAQVPLIVEGYFTPDRLEAKAEFFSRAGFLHVGGRYLYMPADPAEKQPAAAE
jgi:hypothetical protein